MGGIERSIKQHAPVFFFGLACALSSFVVAALLILEPLWPILSRPLFFFFFSDEDEFDVAGLLSSAAAAGFFDFEKIYAKMHERDRESASEQHLVNLVGLLCRFLLLLGGSVLCALLLCLQLGLAALLHASSLAAVVLVLLGKKGLRARKVLRSLEREERIPLYRSHKPLHRYVVVPPLCELMACFGPSEPAIWADEKRLSVEQRRCAAHLPCI